MYVQRHLCVGCVNYRGAATVGGFAHPKAFGSQLAPYLATSKSPKLAPLDRKQGQLSTDVSFVDDVKSTASPHDVSFVSFLDGQIILPIWSIVNQNSSQLKPKKAT